MTRPTCIVRGCDQPATWVTHLRCKAHNDRPPVPRKAHPPKPINQGAALNYLLAALTTMPTGCTSWHLHCDAAGYGMVYVDRRSRPVHQVVCEWYHGPRPPGLQVRHLCGNGRHGCFTPTHLRWGTAVENAADRKRHAFERGL